MNEVGLMEQRFRILASNIGPAEAAAKALAAGAARTRAKYAGVDIHEMTQATSLREMFRAWHWELEFDEEGNVCAVEGPTCGKTGDEKVLFDVVAPFVEEGSYIQIIYDEDNSIWRWTFRDGKCAETKARLVFDEGARVPT